MKILLIDNSKANLCEFTRLLESKLTNMTSSLLCCQTVDDVINFTNSENFDAVILSGSSLNLSQPQKFDNIHKSVSALLRMSNIPVLGICFGMQMISTAYGGQIKRLSHVLNEQRTIHVQKGSVLLNGESCNINVTLSHQDFVEKIPSDFKSYSKLGDTHQIIESVKFQRFGVQFHPERRVMNEQICILDNFLKYVCEKKNIPPRLQIDELQRLQLVMDLKNNKTSWFDLEEKYNITRDHIMYIWRHHMNIWNLSAIML
tara:strand:- start:379 stop:1155 length:777 start_codon:yes stop_codon:yes gene_type:complete